jgi:type IV fimbrial biogenesis protein FimT
MQKNKGFTLIELMVTIAVLAIVASIAAPSMSQLLEKQKFRQVVREYIQTLQNARSQAIVTKNSIAVCIDKTSDKNSINQEQCRDLIFSGADATKKMKLQENNRIHMVHIPEKVLVLSSENDMSVLFTSTGAVLSTENSSPVSRTISFCSNNIKVDIEVSLLGSITNTNGVC